MNMKKINIVVAFVLFLIVPYVSIAQSKKNRKDADKETAAWRYEIEAVGTGVQGSYQVKVWSYSKKPQVAMEQAKKNAVHGIVFKGFPSNGRVQGQKALVQNPNLEKEQTKFFEDFFETGQKYLKFVTLANNGAIGPGDRIKISKKEYKIGVVVSVNVAALRKDLEASGIVKGLGSGF
jgi:hypothetical protein